MVNPGFSELSRTSLMYVDFILSRGGTLPDIITNENLLESFEQISENGSIETVMPITIFTTLSNQSLKIMDTLLIRGHPLPGDLTNASLANELVIIEALDAAAAAAEAANKAN